MTAQAAIHTRGGLGRGTGDGRRTPGAVGQPGLAILYMNCQSILSKLNEFSCLLADTKPDIVLVAESWCNDSISNAHLSVPGYQLQPDLRVDRTDTTNGFGGGLLVYSREGTDILPCDKNSDFNQYVPFKIKLCNVTTTIGLVYRPPNSSDLDGLINIVKQAEPNTILVGDFNMPKIDWDSGTATGKWMDFLDATNDAFMEQLIDFPTHTKGNILDLVLTNAPHLVHDISPEGRLGKSDHESIIIRLTTNQPAKPTVIQRPNWDQADWDGMRNKLDDINWYDTLHGKNTEETWNVVKNCLNDLTNQYVPTRKNRPPNKPMWMSNENEEWFNH